jgi:hypothetical protein
VPGAPALAVPPVLGGDPPVLIAPPVITITAPVPPLFDPPAPELPPAEALVPPVPASGAPAPPSAPPRPPVAAGFGSSEPLPQPASATTTRHPTNLWSVLWVMRPLVGSRHDRYDSPNELIARVFTEDRGAWKEEPLSVADASTEGFGTSAALDREGARAIVGANGSSIARVFVRTNNAWAEEAALSSEGVTGSGFRVALSPDGRRALVLVAESDAMVVFVRSGSTWTLEARTRVHGLGGRNDTGAAALNEDGTLALVGLPSDGPASTAVDSGSVRVFALDRGALRERFQLVPAVGSTGSRFGAAAAISADGARVVVGSPYFGTVPEQYLGRADTFALP